MYMRHRIRNLGVPFLTLVVGIGIGFSGRGWIERDTTQSGSVIQGGLVGAAPATAAESETRAASGDPAAAVVPNASSGERAQQTEDGHAVEDLDDPVAHWIAQTRAAQWPDRWDAVNELGVAGDARGIPALAHVALHDDNAHPRWRSLWAIGSIGDGDRQARPLLVKPLETPEASDRLRYNAAVALAFFGDSAGVALLQDALEHEDSFQRWEAVYSLGILKDSGSAAVLAKRLDHQIESNVRIRGETALVLGRIAASDAPTQLLRALNDDPAQEVRWRAAMALMSVGSAEHEPELRQRLAEEDHPEVQEWIEKAIDAISR